MSDVIKPLLRTFLNESLSVSSSLEIVELLGVLPYDVFEGPSSFDGWLETLATEQYLFAADVLLREGSIVVLKCIVGKGSTHAVDSTMRACLADINSRLAFRTGVRDDRKESGTEAVLGFPDAEGWSSLETSQKALVAILEGAFVLPDQQIADIGDIVVKLVGHTNRFAREQAQLCLSNLIRLSPDTEFTQLSAALFCPSIKLGLHDNWSQVRYAALVATRALIRSSLRIGFTGAFSEEILPALLINRHFVAEGVKRYAQETWKVFTGPQGGVNLVASMLRPVLKELQVAVNSPNHSVRESVCGCLSEVLAKIFANPQYINEVNIYAITAAMSVCVSALEDEAWPVRQIAANCCLVIYRDCEPSIKDESRIILNRNVGLLLNLLECDISDPMLPLRVSSAEAYGYLVGYNCRYLEQSDQIWPKALGYLSRTICLCLDENALKPGAVGIARISAGDTLHENRPMYSCGSLVDNRSIRAARQSLSDDCCSSGHCSSSPSAHPWEVSDGAIRVFSGILGCQILQRERSEELWHMGLPLVKRAYHERGYPKSEFIRRTVEDSLQAAFSSSATFRREFGPAAKAAFPHLAAVWFSHSLE